MALSSMTGFARGHGVTGSYAWSWEIKSVNVKGLDLRLRLPPGWDAIELPARKNATEKLSRGTVYANLSVERKGVLPTVKVNEPVLNAVLATLKSLDGKVDATKPTLDGILRSRARSKSPKKTSAKWIVWPPRKPSSPASTDCSPISSPCGARKAPRSVAC